MPCLCTSSGPSAATYTVSRQSESRLTCRQRQKIQLMVPTPARHHCSTLRAPAAFDSPEPGTQQQQEQRRLPEVLVFDGRCVVTPFDRSNPEEVATIVALQTAAFAKPPTGFGPLDDLGRNIFAAEVLSQMKNKLKFSKEDNFVLLVARELLGSSREPTSSSDGGSGSGGKATTRIAGVVEVSLVADREVLSALRQAEPLGRPQLGTVPYLASMATAPDARRKGVARLLLRGAEAVAAQWDDRMTLHVYADNAPAVSLYQSAGFEPVCRDEGLLAALTLQRPRLLMHKRLDGCL